MWDRDPDSNSADYHKHTPASLDNYWHRCRALTSHKCKISGVMIWPFQFAYYHQEPSIYDFHGHEQIFKREYITEKAYLILKLKGEA